MRFSAISSQQRRASKALRPRWEAAREAVKMNLESADRYLSQLVRLRRYEKDELVEIHDGVPTTAQLRSANEAIAKAHAQ